MIMLKLSGNIRNPKLEDVNSVKKYSQQMNDPYDFLWLPDTKVHLEEIINRYPGVPEVLIYDKNYSVLRNAHGESCQKMLIEFFNDSLVYQYVKTNDSSYIFLKKKTQVVDSGNAPKNYDYTIIYSWVKWTPKLSKDIFKRLDAVKKTNKYKICFISLNKDWEKGMYEEVPRFTGKVGNGGSASAPKY